MIKLLLKIAPYVLLVFFSIAALGGISQAIWGPKTAAGMSCSQIESTALSDLPGWVVVKDAQILWRESITQYREKGDVRINEKLIVPILSAGAMQSWGTFKAGRQTLLVAEIPFSELQEKYPKLAAAASGSKTDLTDADLPKFGSLNLHIAGRNQLAGGITKDAVNQWMTQNGFSESAIIPLDKKPPTASESFSGAVFAGLCAGGNVIWIRRRRRKAREQAAARGYLGGVASAVSQVVAEGVASAMSRAAAEPASGTDPGRKGPTPPQ